MIYDIKLRVFYEYEHPIDLGRQVVRHVPQAPARDQRLLSSRLEILPRPVERRDALDFFGNTLTELGFDCFSSELELNLLARVERSAGGGGLDLSPTPAMLAQELAQTTRLDSSSPLHYLPDSARVRSSSVFQRYGEDKTEGCSTVLETVEALGQALHREMTFLPGATEVDTAPETAFAAMRGVCQDFSHIMIGCLRALGIPAGYVSGFLRTIPPPGQARLEGADAMHAWVRVWCGVDMGWVDYDPTNAMRAGLDHVEVAVGRDYADVSPLRGVTRSWGKGSTGHSVDMIELAPA